MNSYAATFTDNTLSGQVIKAVKVLSEMMTDRGFAGHALQFFSPDDCIAAVLKRDTIQIDVTDRVLLVIYVTSRHNGTSIRTDLKKRIDVSRHSRVILVFRENPVNIESVGTKLREEFAGIHVEIFGLLELQFNVTKHVLVPKHERVDDSNVISSVLKLYGVKKQQLPIIHHNDVICRYLGMESGDLVRVYRKSPTAGVHIAYRLCV